MNREDEFDIVLTSYDDHLLYPNNNPGSFQNLLSKRIKLQGDRSVSLTQICIPVTWSCEMKITIKFVSPNLRAYMLDPVSTTFRFKGHITDLIDRLSEIINHIPIDKPMWLGMNPKTNLIEIAHGELTLADGMKIMLYPEFDDETTRLLGLPKTIPNDPDNPPAYMGTQPIRFNFEREQFFIYSNISDSIHVGSIEKPLLNYFTAPPGLQFGQNLMIKFDQREKRRLKVTDLQNISIDIKNKHGNIPSFEFGDSYITLHFERNAY